MFNPKSLKRILNTFETEADWREAKCIIANGYSKWREKHKEEYYKEFKKIKDNFKVGDKVVFEGRQKEGNSRHIGEIIKCNPIKAKVKVLVGKMPGPWVVHYSYLKKPTREDLILLSIAKMKGETI